MAGSKVLGTWAGYIIVTLSSNANKLEQLRHRGSHTQVENVLSSVGKFELTRRTAA
jgi:hypothetical protein